MTYHGKIIAGGKVVVPADLRRLLGFKDGDAVVFEQDGASVKIKSRKQVLQEIQTNFRTLIKEPFTVDEFIADRRVEAERE
jgi:bifunctional DNA-binding transcriptional regulator/antitoxin component of YhaV-PrlF toxin-antitoxin module